ncbi:hypothetical protein Tco_0588146 [Tanacetum coccineum]|uniref:Uncharacterized protein n=1 Tax=Tanacetum coccineum TaxID=301880 RepID=A0ABQ5D6L0_9ASTR
MCMFALHPGVLLNQKTLRRQWLIQHGYEAMQDDIPSSCQGDYNVLGLVWTNLCLRVIKLKWIFVAYAAHKYFSNLQMDVKTGISYWASLKEEVRFAQPEDSLISII